MEERYIAPVPRLLIRPQRPALLPEAFPRRLEEAFQILERQREQRPQMPEPAVRPLYAHECGERVGVVDRKRRRVVHRIIETRRLRPHNAGGQFERERDGADVGLGVGADRRRGVREAHGRRVGAGFRQEPAGETRGQRGVAGGAGDIEDLERRANADPLGMRASPERPLLLPREARLDREDPGDDVRDVLLLRRQLALEFHAGDAQILADSEIYSAP